MKFLDLLSHYAETLAEDRRAVSERHLDTPLMCSAVGHASTIGSLHLYTCCQSSTATATSLPEDVPITLVPGGGEESTEGLVLGPSAAEPAGIVVQLFDAMGPSLSAATVVPDTTAYIDAIAQRLTDIRMKPEYFSLGPAERLVPWLAPERHTESAMSPEETAVAAFQTIWAQTLTERRAKAATLAAELARANKRLLVITPSHRDADAVTAVLARVLRAAGMSYKSLLCRYELAVTSNVAAVPLTELGFEAQRFQFYAQSRADKAALRKKYERFRELTPLLAYKAEKQTDLDEVKLLEWRLLTQIAELQEKIKETNATLAQYEAIPIWKRLAMQTVGKNIASLQEYRSLYETQITGLKKDVDVARERIAALTPEAAIPKDLRPEYQDLKEEVVRLGGTKKIRELLAAEEGTNRQAFIQNKRVVVATASRIASDPLFRRVRFDALIADEVTDIPAPLLAAAAGLIRDKIIVAGAPDRVSALAKLPSILTRPAGAGRATEPVAR